MKGLKIVLGALALSAFLLACGGGGESDSAAVDPASLISTAAQKLDEANSFQLALAVSGAPATLDANAIGTDLILTLQRAEGVFVRPDGLQGKVTVKIEDAAAEVEMAAIGDDQYLRHVLLTGGTWQALTFSPDFNPANLVTGEASIAAALRAAQNVTLVGEEDLDGLPVYHLKGQVEAARVESVTVGLIGTATGLIQVDFYIRQRDGLLERLDLTEPIAEGQTEATRWTIGLYEYNGEFTVNRPKVGS
jgi:hypothetical protein